MAVRTARFSGSVTAGGFFRRAISAGTSSAAASDATARSAMMGRSLRGGIAWGKRGARFAPSITSGASSMQRPHAGALARELLAEIEVRVAGVRGELDEADADAARPAQEAVLVVVEDVVVLDL